MAAKELTMSDETEFGQQVRSNDELGVEPAAWLIDENGPHTRSVYCVFDEGERSRCLEDGAKVTATPLYAIPQGWRLVPEVPTNDMLDAGPPPKPGALMKITESRANDILHWLDDETGNHALLFEKMTLHRDAAALIRQLQAADDTNESLLRAAAGLVRELDAAEQAAWHAGLDAGREQGRGKDRATAAKDAEIEALRVEVAAQRTRADAMAGEAIKHEARAERLKEALHAAVGSAEAGITPLPRPPAAQPRA